MKKYKLGEIADFVEERISSEDISLDEYVTTDSLLQNKKGRVMAQNLPPKKCSLTYYKKGDVLIGNIRPYLKKIWLADTSGGCSQDVLVLRSKKDSDSEFLYATLMQDDFFDYVMKATKGSKMPRGDKNHIMHFICFDVKNKNKIGELFSSLDKKIALNSRINARLEQMAKRLYEHYFVQFDFPAEDGKPYKTSGGKMVYSSELKREIPEGWEVKRLGDILKNNIEVTDAGEHLKGLKYCPIDEIPMKTMSFANGKPYTEANSSLQLYKRKDILIGAMRVYFHRCCIASEPGITRTTTIVVSPKNKNFLSYVYQVCNEDKTFDYAIKVSNGTQQPYVTWKSLKEYQFVYPKDEKIIEGFCKNTNSIIDRILENVQESARLTSLRDRLLPLLMNGQVSV